MSRFNRLDWRIRSDAWNDSMEADSSGSLLQTVYARTTAARAPGGGGGGATTKPSLTVAALSAVKPEGNSGTTTPYTFTVTRAGSTAGTSTVNWAVTGSGANPANAADFGGNLPGSKLTFGPGVSSLTITVNVAPDATVELDENFTVTLSGVSKGTTIATPTATGTILNDDGAATLPVLTIAATDAVKSEGDSGTTPFTFTVTRTGTTGTSSAGWVISGADAADFSGPLSGTVELSDGQSTKIITVNVVGDTTVETDEAFSVTLINPTNATLGTNSVGGTIVNDDISTQPPTYLSSAPGSAFNIEIVFAGAGWTAELVELVQDAADIVSGIIIGDISNINNYPTNGDFIDDVRVTVSIGDIDQGGAGGLFGSNIVAQSQVLAYRDSSDVGGKANELFLPVTATMTLDEFDIAAAIDAGTVLGWDGIILHEMIHTVGFLGGAFQPAMFNFKQLIGADDNGFPRFIGPHANNAYLGGSPLVAATGPFDGILMPLFDYSHWDDANFSPVLDAADLTAIGGLSVSQELMTAVFVGGFFEPTWLSDVTVGALKDLGYTVADPSAASGITIDALFAQHAG